MLRIRDLMTFGLAMVLVVGAAHATDYTLTYTHFVKLAVPTQQDGKDVTRVEAKVGALATRMHLPGQPWFPSYPMQPFLAGERTVTLEKKGDHFFGKTRVDVFEQPPGPNMGPVMVEYTVTFADGSRKSYPRQVVLTSEDFKASDGQEYMKLVATAEKGFNQTQDATESGCVTVSLYTRGPAY